MSTLVEPPVVTASPTQRLRTTMAAARASTLAYLSSIIRPAATWTKSPARLRRAGVPSTIFTPLKRGPAAEESTAGRGIGLSTPIAGVGGAAICGACGSCGAAFRASISSSRAARSSSGTSGISSALFAAAIARPESSSFAWRTARSAFGSVRPRLRGSMAWLNALWAWSRSPSATSAGQSLTSRVG